MFNPREEAALAREAYDALYLLRQGKPDMELGEELELEIQFLLSRLENVVDSMSRLRRIWDGNDLTTKMKERKLPETRFSWERTVELAKAFEALEILFQQDLVVMPENENFPEVVRTPLQIVSQRGNPAPYWGQSLKEIIVIP